MTIIDSLVIPLRVVAYFEALATRFDLDGEVTALEVFDPAGFLPPIVQVAELRLQKLGMTLTPQFPVSNAALFHCTVDIPWTPMATQAVIQAAEDLIFNGAPVCRSALIDLRPLYEFFSSPVEKRSESTWKPRKE